MFSETYKHKIYVNKKMKERIKSLQEEKKEVYSNIGLRAINVVQSCSEEPKKYVNIGDVKDYAREYCTSISYILGNSDGDTISDCRRVFDMKREDLYKISNILYCYKYDVDPYNLSYLLNVILISLDEVLGTEFIGTLDVISEDDWQVFNNLYLTQILNNDTGEYTSFLQKVIETGSKLYNIKFFETNDEEKVEIRIISDVLSILALVRPEVRVYKPTFGKEPPKDNDKK